MKTNRLKLILFMVLVVTTVAQARKQILLVIHTPDVLCLGE